MGLGIELLFNMSTNSKMFEQGIKSASSGAEKFYKGFTTQLKETQNKLNLSGTTLQSFNTILKEAVPIGIDFNEALSGGSKGDQFILSRTLDGATASLETLDKGFQNFFGKTLSDDTMHKLSTDLMDMGAVKFNNLGTSIEKFTSDLNDFSPKQQKAYVDLMDRLENPKVGDSVENIADQMKRITDAPMKETTDKMDRFSKSLQTTARYALGLGSIQQIFSEIMTVQTDLAKTTWQMGVASEGAFDTANMGALKAGRANASLKNEVRNTTASFMDMNREIANNTQTSLSEVGATMNELMSMRVGSLNNDFGELAETSMLMQKGLGMSSSSANNFVRDLSLIGGVGSKDIKAAAQEISYVQQNLGLTESEAQLVGATVGKLMRQFRTFGGNSKDVAIVTKEVGKMTAAFASVGLAADDAQAIVQNMMNPDNLQKSILLWSSMGMSAADGFAMMHGEGKNMEGMTSKMVQAAKDLKTQYGGNIFALKAMSEAHGMSLEQVQALSEYDASRLQDMQKQAKLEEAANAARQGINDQMKRLKDQLMVILQSFLLPILKVLGAMLEPIVMFLSKMNEWADQGNIIQKIFGGIGRILTFGILLGIMGLLPGLGLVKKAVGGIFNLFKGGLKGPLSALKDKFGGIAKSSKDIGKSGGGMKKFTQSFKDLPDPKKILAFAGGMLMIAAGIAIIILSLTSLVKAVAEGNLAFSQLAGIALILLPVFAGFIGIMYTMPPIIKAIGQAGAQGAVGLLAFGVAMLLMGAGIYLIVTSLAKLIGAFAMLAGPQIMGALGGLIIVFVGLIAVMIAMAIIGATVGWAIAIVGAAFLMLGIGVAMVGLGIKMIVDAFRELASTVIPLLVSSFIKIGENAGMIAAGLITVALAALAFVAASFAMISGAIAFNVALLMLAGSIPLLFLLGFAAAGVGEAMLNMGMGAELMSTHFSEAVQGLRSFKEELGGGWKKVVDQVVSEIERMNEALKESKKITLGSMAAVVTHMIAGKLSSESDSKKGAKSTDYTSSLNTANTHLNTIANNTADTNKLLKELIVETKKRKVVRSTTKLTANMGV